MFVKNTQGNDYLIVGLGNPGSAYDNTRHNIGFMVADALAKSGNKTFESCRYGDMVKIRVKNCELMILKPSTFMNLSGEALFEFVNFYKIELDKIIIIYDDLDIEPGKIRIRKNGSAGSHNGMKSIIQHLKNENFTRIRVGIGKPKGNLNMIEYVIGGIPEEEKQVLQEGVEKAKNAVVEILKNGIDKSMNKFN